ncbi:MAG: sigma-70 family RNA polymerase sigma factor [Nannocystaceae bacterium]
MASAAQRSEPAKLAFLPSADDRVHVERLRDGDRVAIAALFDRHGAAIERVLLRVLGPDPELPDLLHDVFVQAMTGIGRFRGDAATLRPWLLQIAIRTARKCLRRRATRRFLGLRTPGELPEIADASDPEQQTALGRAQLALLRLPADLRIAFGLRWIAGMQLDEVAAACEVSLATAKRRLTQARARFERVAARDPVLASWLREVAS